MVVTQCVHATYRHLPSGLDVEMLPLTIRQNVNFFCAEFFITLSSNQSFKRKWHIQEERGNGETKLMKRAPVPRLTLQMQIKLLSSNVRSHFDVLLDTKPTLCFDIDYMCTCTDDPDYITHVYVMTRG